MIAKNQQLIRKEAARATPKYHLSRRVPEHVKRCWFEVAFKSPTASPGTGRLAEAHTVGGGEGCQDASRAHGIGWLLHLQA